MLSVLCTMVSCLLSLLLVVNSPLGVLLWTGLLLSPTPLLSSFQGLKGRCSGQLS